MIDLNALPYGGARCAFGVRGLSSPVRFHVDTVLGSCNLAPRHDSALSGTLLEYLRPGAHNVGLGQDGGGHCTCNSRLSGAVGEEHDGDPATLKIALRTLALSPHSRPFGIGAQGEFLARAQWEITSGSLELAMPGWGTRTLDLRGQSSPERSGLGRIRFDAGGVHIARQLELAFDLREPSWGLHLILQVHGLLCGDMQYPGDWPGRGH